MELGGAANWNVKDGGSSFGPTVAVEVTPIENWLELEAGVTPLFSRPHDRMGYRPAIQEALDAVEKSGVYDWSWSCLGAYEEIRRDNELRRAVKPYWILCFGPPRSIDSVGTLNRATNTTSGEAMSNRSA